MGVVIVVHRQADLLEVIFAGKQIGGLANLLDRGQQQGDQHADDRDHDEQFDQGERSSGRRGRTHDFLRKTIVDSSRLNFKGIRGSRLDPLFIICYFRVARGTKGIVPEKAKRANWKISPLSGNS